MQIGASNTDLQILEDYIRAGQIGCEFRKKLSILDRKSESNCFLSVKEHGIMLQTYSLLNRGFWQEKHLIIMFRNREKCGMGKTWWRPENIRRVNGMLADGRTMTEKISV